MRWDSFRVSSSRIATCIVADITSRYSWIVRRVACTIYRSFFFQAEDGIRDYKVTGVQTCALPIWGRVLRFCECHRDGYGVQGPGGLSAARGRRVLPEWRLLWRVRQRLCAVQLCQDRKSVGLGKRVDLGGGRII